MVIRHWLCAVILTLITMGGIVRAQTPYKVDSSEHVGFLTTGSIGSTQTPPYWIRLTTGAGASYARVGVPMLIELRDTTSDSAFYGKFELDSVSQIVGDSLYVVKRALSNSSKYSWSAGTRAQIVNNNSIIISALRSKTTAINGLPDTTGNAGKYLLDSANGIGPVWTTVPSTTVAGVASFNARTGVVVPTLGDYGFSKISGTAATTQGGTGLTSILPTKILYSPSSNTFGPLTLSSSFTITHDTLFGVGFQSALPDTTGNAGKVLKDSANGVGLIWSSAGAGTVTSVNVGGGLSGLTFSGGPITNTGTAQISGGQLGVAYGGTGAGTAAQARVNLLPDTSGHTGQFLFLPPGGGITWDTAVGGGGGGVTSVNVAIGGMTSSGAITTSGTITMSGTLAVANGGTALSTTPANGKLLIGNGTNYTLANITGTSNEVTVTNGAGTITLATPQAIGTSSDVQFDSLTLLKPLPITSGGTGRSTVDTGALLYGHGASTMASLAAGADGTVLQIASGLPAYTATLSSTVQGNITTLGTISTGTWSATTIAASKGGTGIASPTIHKLLAGNGSSAMTQLAVGATNTVLHGNTGADPSFSAIATGDIIDSNVTAAKIATGAVDLTQQVGGVLPIGNGGTGLANIFGTANTWTAVQTVNKANIQTTYTDGLALTNATASDVSHTVQQSPSLSLLAHVWNTTSTATDSTETWRITNVPTSGASTTSSLMLDNGNTAGGFSNVGSLSDAGAFNVKTGGSYQINGTSVLNATTLGSGVTASSLTSVGTLGSLSLGGDLTMSGGLAHSMSIAASSSAAGGALTVAGGAGNGTDMNSGGVTISTGASTGSGSGTVTIAVAPSGGSTGTASRSATTAALFTQSSTETKLQLGLTNGSHAGALAFSNGGSGGDLLTIHLATISGSHNDTLPSVYGSFVMNAGGQTIDGAKIFTTGITTAGATSNGNITFDTTSRSISMGTSFSASTHGISITGGGASGTGGSGGPVSVNGGAGSAGDGGTVTLATGAAQGTNNNPGNLFLKCGASTGTGVGNIEFYLPTPGTSGSASRSTALAANLTVNSTGANFQVGVSGTDGSLTFFKGGNSVALASASLGGNRTYTMQDAGAAADVLFETSDLHATGSLITSTSTRGVLSSVTIGSTNDILTVAAGIPSWTSTPTLSALNVTNGTTLNGAFNLHVQTTKTTTYTILSSDCVVPCDATSAAFTATLPAGATVGQVMILSKIDAGVNAVTIAPGAGQTIIAATGVLSGGNVSLTTTDPTAHLCYIGSNNWILISRD